MNNNIGRSAIGMQFRRGGVGVTRWLWQRKTQLPSLVFYSAAMLDMGGLAYRHVQQGLHEVPSAPASATPGEKFLVPTQRALTTVLAGGFVHPLVDTANFVIGAKPATGPLSQFTGMLCNWGVAALPQEAKNLKPYVSGGCRGIVELWNIRASLMGIVVGSAGAVIEKMAGYNSAPVLPDQASPSKVSFNLPPAKLG